MMETKLDTKDRKILCELSLNGREPASKVAKKLGLSKQVVKYRIENLQKMGVIEGYYAILNINKLGYLYHRVFFKFGHVTPEKEDELIQFCKEHKRIGWIFQLYGDWDFAIAVWARDSIELEGVLDEILERFGGCFDGKFVSVSTAIYHLKNKFLIGERDSAGLVMGGAVERAKLDPVDYDLVGMLAKDGRMSLQDLGKELGISPKVVRYRINRLTRMGVILGVNVKINYKLLGYAHHKVFLNLTNISSSGVKRLIAYLKALEHTIYITKAVGVSDVEFELLVRSNEEVHSTMRELRHMFSDLIKNYSSFLIYNEPYINYLPMKK